MAAKKAPKRKAITAGVRFEVFKRDAFTCAYCGAHPPEVILQCDHILPVAEGGSNDDSNLITSCDRCNLGKGAKLLSAIPQSLQDKAAEAAEREAQVRGYSETLRSIRERIQDDAWSVAELFMQNFLSESIRKDYFQSIVNFIKRLPTPVVEEAMEMSLARHYGQQSAFRYFCGICWKTIRGQQHEC